MQLLSIAMFAYVLGTIALGAHAMGHEYTHRTLGLLLSQPSTRSRVFLTKMAVLGGMLVLLMAVAWVTVFDGPLEWQVLLPMEVWRQWAIKVGTALSLAVLLGFGAPLLLARIDASPDDLRMHYDMIPVVMALTGGSLYLSSLCSSGMRAVVLALPVIFGMILSIDEGGRMITRAVHLVPPDFLVRTLSPARAVMPVESWAILLVGSWVMLLLWFGMQNYRSGDRSFARVWRQAAWIGGCGVTGMTLVAALEVAFRMAWLSPAP